MPTNLGEVSAPKRKAQLLEHVPSGLNREDSPGAVYEGFYRH